MGRHKDPEYHSKYYRDNKSVYAVRQRKHLLKIRYGLTVEQYDQLLEQQNECCPVCQRHYSQFKTRLAVDHNHDTGEIRGLLCTFCNRFFIGRHTDAEAFERASQYLRQGTGLFVPPDARKPKRRRRKKRKA